MICMIGCVVGGFLNNEVAFSIPFYAMLATGAAYVVRRLMLRRRRSQASQNNLA